MVEASTNKEVGPSLAKSKYSMLEVFSFLYTRREAIYNLRLINKRFKNYSKDPYLENYSQGRTTEMIYYEVRA